MAKDRKVVLITRRTRFQDLVSQYNTEAQAAFVIESRGLDLEQFKREHEQYSKALKAVNTALQDITRVQHLERRFLPNFIFGGSDIVVVLGQDRLVANTLKYLAGQPVIAINPDPEKYDGLLLPFISTEVIFVLREVMQDKRPSQSVTMASAQVNDGQQLTAVNDFFVGPKFHTSAQYELHFNGKIETQSSSGVIVSTGLGSTGWMRSVVAGAHGILGGNNAPSTEAWDSQSLQFAVRVPFPSQTTGTSLVFGRINSKTRFSITSQMPQNGVLSSDRMIEDYIKFNSGATVEIGISDQHGQLII